MLDVKWIVKNPEECDRMLARKGCEPVANKISDMYEQVKQTKQLIENLQHARKEKAQALGSMKDKSSQAFVALRKDAQDLNDKIKELSSDLSIEEEMNSLLQALPNFPHEEVPDGDDESMNKEIRKWGEPRQIEGAKQHFELGENLGMMDFTQTAKFSGSRFVSLKSDLARLERALVSFMMDVQTREFEFTEMSVPQLVRDEAMYGAGQLPKFAEDSFETTNNYRLIPTAEVPLVNMVREMIIPREDLPMRLVSHTQCFRSEAGSAGRDTRGMIRLHQFGKVELVTISTPDEAEREHEHILNAAETVLKRLDLPYRVVELCTGDIGFTHKRAFDIEVWLPGQNKYREISSCSNCGDFQARRIKARYKEFGDKETTLVHTQNGSGLAVGRTLVAILENYQNEDGTITVPKALVDYMGGIEKIG